MKRLKLLAATAAAFLLPLAASSTAQSAYSDFYYYYVFYSSPAKTEVVGHYSEYCLNNTTIITPLVTGRTSPYYDRIALGVCPGMGDW